MKARTEKEKKKNVPDGTFHFILVTLFLFHTK